MDAFDTTLLHSDGFHFGPLKADTLDFAFEDAQSLRRAESKESLSSILTTDSDLDGSSHSSRKRKRSDSNSETMRSAAADESSVSFDDDWIESKEPFLSRTSIAGRSASPSPSLNPARKDQVCEEYVASLLARKPRTLTAEERAIRRRAINRQSAATARVRRIAKAKSLESTSVQAVHQTQSLARQIASVREENAALVRVVRSLGYAWDPASLSVSACADVDNYLSDDVCERPTKVQRVY